MRRLTAASLQAILPGEPNVDMVDTGFGYHRVTAVWPDGARFKLDVYPDHVDWKNLSAASDKEPNGLYSELARVTPPYFLERGRRFYVMTPGSDAARDRLLARGVWEPQDDGSYRWDLDAVA